MFSFEPLANARSSLSQPKPEPITCMALLAQGRPLDLKRLRELSEYGMVPHCQLGADYPLPVSLGDDLIHGSEVMHW